MPNPKDYPYWPQLVKALEDLGHTVVQIGLEGEKPLVDTFHKGLTLSEISMLVVESDFWISVDSFLPHLAHHLRKPGIVLWGPSDPRIFGYPENRNLTRGPTYYRKNQFSFWEDCTADPEAFVLPEDVLKVVESLTTAERE
jgi:ADP-heptose:LPS heptosyltransferase